MLRWTLALLPLLATSPVLADAPAGDAARGRRTLESRGFNPAAWTVSAFESVWKQWGLKNKPSDFDAQLRERYGLHPAPYANDGLPMGLRKGGGLVVGRGIAVDCLVCHGGSIMGQSYIGLGNSSLDVDALFDELNRASGRKVKLPFRFSNVRGTSEAVGMGVYLLGMRDANLNPRLPRVELGLHDDICSDVPAWWHLKKKRTMYHTGASDSRSVRSLMQFMMGSLSGPQTFNREEAAFRDVQAFLLSLTPPKYPFAIDRDLAATGQKVFEQNCAKCHGTYGDNPTYPNRIVKLDEIGTDPNRFRGLEPAFGEYYNRSWFAKERVGWLYDDMTALPTNGYQAPPLDGIWATAPYLHNGSVPTVHHLLKSDERPKLFTRSYRTSAEDYDLEKLGWKVTKLDAPASETQPAIERRKVYDTSQSGRHNTGHIYGDDLSDAQRRAVIEYLKTL